MIPQPSAVYGYMLVPIQPTTKMVEAGRIAMKVAPDLAGIVSEYTPEVMDAYAAMLAVAPTPPKVTFATPDDIALYQGPDDVPVLMIAGAAVAKFPAGSWGKVCDALNDIAGPSDTAPPGGEVVQKGLVGYFDPDVVAHFTDSIIDPVGVLRRKPNGINTVPVYIGAPPSADVSAFLRDVVEIAERHFADRSHAPAADASLADTQRQIIEAAERRGYERGLAERMDAEKLRELVAKWRDGFDAEGYPLPHDHNSILHACAHELEAILDAQQAEGSE